MLTQMEENGYRGTFHITAVENRFVEQATVEQSLKRLKLDENSIAETVLSAVGNKGEKKCRIKKDWIFYWSKRELRHPEKRQKH